MPLFEPLFQIKNADWFTLCVILIGLFRKIDFDLVNILTNTNIAQWKGVWDWGDLVLQLMVTDRSLKVPVPAALCCRRQHV